MSAQIALNFALMSHEGLFAFFRKGGFEGKVFSTVAAGRGDGAYGFKLLMSTVRAGDLLSGGFSFTHADYLAA